MLLPAAIAMFQNDPRCTNLGDCLTPLCNPERHTELPARLRLHSLISMSEKVNQRCDSTRLRDVAALTLQGLNLEAWLEAWLPRGGALCLYWDSVGIKYTLWDASEGAVPAHCKIPHDCIDTLQLRGLGWGHEIVGGNDLHGGAPQSSSLGPAQQKGRDHAHKQKYVYLYIRTHKYVHNHTCMRVYIPICSDTHTHKEHTRIMGDSPQGVHRNYYFQNPFFLNSMKNLYSPSFHLTFHIPFHLFLHDWGKSL